jgi:hypothetical protein
MTPPVQPSPQVPRDLVDEPEQITGVYPATREYARHIGWLSVARAAGLLLLSVAVSAILGYRWIMGEARAQGETAVAVVAQKQAASQEQLDRYQKDTNESLGDVKTELKETREDLKALYQATMNGRRQERLESTDGGK